MAVVIRMKRTGRRNRPCYRISVADSRWPRDGRFLESIGLYDPVAPSEENQVVVDVERAREHFEKDVQICEQTGDRYGAGQTRFNLAVIYLQSASTGATGPADPRPMLERAQAYAQAALRDYQHYQGRAAKDEAKAQELIDHIAALLDKT